MSEPLIATVLHSPECFASYMGMWMYEPGRLVAGLAALREGRIAAKMNSGDADDQDQPPYAIERGIALMSISGTMMKAKSKFGGTSTVAVRRAIRAAVTDARVHGIMLNIDSPGGTVAGTNDLADDFRRAGQIKPTAAHTDDIMASAALYVGSQANVLSAGPAAEVGSIGTVAVVEDSSQRAEMAGVKVHVVSTGPYKGAFYDGAPVTQEHLAYMQDRVNEASEMFIDTVAAGRRMNKADVRKLADGRVFGAEASLGSGLIDKVQRFDEAFRGLERVIADRASESRRRTKAISAEMGLLELDML